MKTKKNVKQAGKQPEKDVRTDIEVIVDEVKRKSEKRRKTDFSSQRTPDFLLSIERAVSMGQRDQITTAIRNMFSDTDVSLDRLFGDILPQLSESVEEMLSDDSVWSYIKYNSTFRKPSAKPVNRKNATPAHITRGSNTQAIMSTLEGIAAVYDKETSEAYSRAVDAVIEDLRIRLLRKIGCIKVAVDKDRPAAIPIDVE